MKLSTFHPLTALVYFAAVLVVTMFCLSPAVVVCSAAGGLLAEFALRRDVWRFFKDVGAYLAMWAVITLSNPLFVHKGLTPLFFVNGRAYTLEALCYGAVMGGGLAAVIMWFKVLGKILTREKLLYIFGRKTPKTALIITAAMGFIPKLKGLHRQISDSLKCTGSNNSDSRLDRFKTACGMFTALCAGCLENAADVSISMKARGFCTGKRSFAHGFRFRLFDGIFAGAFILLFVIVMIERSRGALLAEFYPRFEIFEKGVLGVVAFGILCAMPFILEVKERLKWKFFLARA